MLGEPSAPAVGQLSGKDKAARSVQLRNEGAQSPGATETKEFTPYRAWSAAPDDSGGCWDKGRKARLRDTAAPTKLLPLLTDCYGQGNKNRFQNTTYLGQADSYIYSR